MTRKCELCESLEIEALGTKQDLKGGKLRRVLVESRVLALCDAHAARVRALKDATLSELRSAFVEPGGKRSLLARRAPLDRRMFPARPEGRRASSGRRAGDGDD